MSTYQDYTRAEESVVEFLEHTRELKAARVIALDRACADPAGALAVLRQSWPVNQSRQGTMATRW